MSSGTNLGPAELLQTEFQLLLASTNMPQKGNIWSSCTIHDLIAVFKIKM